ncbi:MAG: hypothetical protein V3V08_01635 [Nannocystaceae bacterium]
MKSPRKLSLQLLSCAVALSLTVPACGGSRKDERWVTTDNTTVDIDWDAVGEAYKRADGPEDFEEKVNEIYTGDQIISVTVQDAADRGQTVTGFFDTDANGQAAESEKIFTIKREVKGEGGQYQIRGQGMYQSYHSPMWSFASGMLMGSMMSRMFMPSYMPMYATPYRTSGARRGALATHRSSWRKSNPAKFNAASKKSRSGRSYGKKGGSFGGGRATPSRSRAPSRSRGGGSFGIRRHAHRVVTLT